MTHGTIRRVSPGQGMGIWLVLHRLVHRPDMPGIDVVAAGVTTSVSLLWVILLCVEIFALYDQSDPAQSECPCSMCLSQN